MPQYSFLPFLQPFPIGTRILTGLLISFSLLNVLINTVWEQHNHLIDHLEQSADEVGLGKAASAASKLGKLGGLGALVKGGKGGYAPYLVCVQGEAVPWFVWTFLTAGAVEVKGIEVSAERASGWLRVQRVKRVGAKVVGSWDCGSG